MFIPALCASAKHIDAMPKDVFLNFYVGSGTVVNDLSESLRDLCTIHDRKNMIKMVHLLVPESVTEYFEINEPYIDFVKSLGRVGITVHYIMPRDHKDENILFSEFVRIHNAIPEAILYIENTHSDIYGLLNMVRALNDIDIEAYMLIDTCHLEMDSTGWTGLPKQDICLTDFFKTYKKYIGAVHISASRKDDGFNHNTHGKPIYSETDYEFFKMICESLAGVKFDNDVIVIPEVLEDTYDETCTRQNGMRAYSYICQILGLS